MNTPDHSTDEREARRQAIIRTACDLTRHAFGERFEIAEQAAADAAEDTSEDEDAKPPVAKLTLAFSWFAGQVRPELEAKVSFSQRRVLTLSAPTDQEQGRLTFDTARDIIGQ